MTVVITNTPPPTHLAAIGGFQRLILSFQLVILPLSFD
jgi:hypothetical protein